MVECNVANVDVAGSNPVSRSLSKERFYLFKRRCDKEEYCMEIMEFLSKRAINADLKATDKDGAIKELASLFVEAGEIEPKDKKKLVDVLMAREALGSTAIGQGIAIPHGKTDCVEKLVAALGLSKKGVNFESLDGEPVYIFFLLVAPHDTAGPHLKALARISRLLKDKYFREQLRQAKDAKEVLAIIKAEDAKKI